MIEWLDGKLKDISRMLTKNHQTLVRQLLGYKSRTNQKLKEYEMFKERMQQAETMLASNNQVLEA